MGTWARIHELDANGWVLCALVGRRATGHDARVPAGPIGLVLSGGGARGAYEAGALLYVAETRPELLERVRIVTGSSVGAFNATFLASRGLTSESVRALVDLWKNLKIDDLLSVSHRSAAKIVTAAPLRLLKLGVKSPAVGLLDARRLWRLIGRQAQWGQIHANVENGRFDAVAIAATDIARGEPHLFVDAKSGLLSTDSAVSSEFEWVTTRIRLAHVLASAAMPLLFPPVHIGDRWYMDGGIRNNTPLSPALRLGAQSLLIVDPGGLETGEGTLDGYPGLGQVVGKVLDAIFLDGVAYDLDRLTRVNDVVRAIERLGEEEAERFRTELEARGRPRYRHVAHASIVGDTDFGALAAEYIKGSKTVSAFSFMRVLGALFENDARTSGDAASFLLFDGGFAEMLIARGIEDAARTRDQFTAL